MSILSSRQAWDSTSVTKRWAAASVLAGVAAAVVNARLTSHALADIQGTLGSSRDETAWVGTAFVAAEAFVIPLAAWLSAVLSIRRVVVPAALVFAAACISCAWVQTVEQLIALRLVQGMSGGMLIPMATPTFRRNLPMQARVFAFAFYGMAATVPMAFGPMVDALFVDGWTWRAIFVFPAALALFCAVAAFFALPKQSIDRAGFWRADHLSIFSLGAGLACLLLALEQGYRLDWLDSDWVRGFSAAALLLFAVVIVRARHHRHPLLALDLLSRPNFVIALSVYGVVRLSLHMMTWLLPDLLARTRGFRPADFALLFSAMCLPQMALPWVITRRVLLVDPRLTFSVAIALQCTACLLAASVTGDWSVPELLPIVMLHASGQGLLFVPLLLLLTQNLDDTHRPSAVILTNLTRSFGNTAASALGTSLLAFRTQAHTVAAFEHAAPLTREPLVMAYGDVMMTTGLLLLACVSLLVWLRPVDTTELRNPTGGAVNRTPASPNEHPA